MTVKELIEFLLKEHPDMEVTVDGYEGGYNPVGLIHRQLVKEDPKPKWYYGKYKQTTTEGKVVLVIPR
jgi:hypothetical protein